MKISVVTNAFNQGKYLAAAAESVLGQAGVEVEYIIVEPGSTDETPQVLEALSRRYPGKFTLVSDPDDGPSDGLNKGFAQASGDWFIYLNADDVFLPGAFAEAARHMRANPDAGAVLGNGYIIDDDGHYIRRAVSTRFTARRFVQGTAFALQQSTFYRAKVFRQIGGFKLANSTSWDAELLIDMDRAGFDLVNASGYWSLFRMQPNSITVSQRFADESLRTHERYFLEEMGRERTASDLRLKKVRQQLSRLADPAGTAMRLRDAVFTSNRVFKEAQAPEWARALS